MVPSDYTFLNVGDIAMIQAALDRLDTLWPHARIDVRTEDPAGLARHCPHAEPLVMSGQQYRSQDESMLIRLALSMPGAVAHRLIGTGCFLRRQWCKRAGPVLGTHCRWLGAGPSPVAELTEHVAVSDLVVVAGMGGITDWFEEYALELLDTLLLAIRLGKPTAMLGQGIGPLQRERLWHRARAVLPRVDLIALRECRIGGPLLASLGVAPEHIVTTGDDAIELAYRVRQTHLGDGLGVNLRIGWYSKVGDMLVERVRPVLQEAARTYGAPLVPVPISRTPGEADAVTIRQLAAGYPSMLGDPEPLDTPLEVIERVRRCRLVVTGSYHAAVFALAQGIPTICLINSSYYAAKFEGLADQFGDGCDVVFLDDLRFTCNLADAIRRGWAAADRVRPQLLEAASRQIEQGYAAYRRLGELVGTRTSR
jgi:colanic acid/amylovoran biosynthesis protein